MNNDEEARFAVTPSFVLTHIYFKHFILIELGAWLPQITRELKRGTQSGPQMY